MIEADLISSPRTLRLFLNGKQQKIGFKNNPENINFGV